MANKDYFLILPLLLYGLAISDLVNSWRSFFIKEKRYWPHVITSLLLLEISFWNFYQLDQWMTEDTFMSYFMYFKVLFPPLIFLLVVAVFTPDSDEKDIKGYFQKNMPIIFGGIALFVASHFLLEWDKNIIIRVLGILTLLATAFFRKEWMIYGVLFYRIGSWLVSF